MKIAVLSTDSEQYLLQWWLPHHVKKFDFGVILDFGLTETDNTYELYKTHAPNWRYLKINQKTIGCFLWDVIISKVERDLLDEFPGSWVTTLNATEFLIGDLRSLDKMLENTQVLMPCHLMNDSLEHEMVEPDVNKPLLEQRTHGVHYNNDFPHPHQGESIKLFNQLNPPNVMLNTRWMRSIHNYNVDYLSTSVYSVGRHYWEPMKMSTHLAICHMNYAPFTRAFIDRKLNVQNRLTEEDHRADRGIHHRINEQTIYDRKRFYDRLTVDLKSYIDNLENV
jgi:hypothetical protein